MCSQKEADHYFEKAVKIFSSPTIEELRTIFVGKLPEVDGILDSFVLRKEVYINLAETLLNQKHYFKLKLFLSILGYPFSSILDAKLKQLDINDSEFKQLIDLRCAEANITHRIATDELHAGNYLSAAAIFGTRAVETARASSYFSAYFNFQAQAYSYEQCAEVAGKKNPASVLFLENASEAMASSYEMQYMQSRSIPALSKAIKILQKYDNEEKESDTKNKFSKTLIHLLCSRGNEYINALIKEYPKAKADFEAVVAYGDKSAKAKIVNIFIKTIELEKALKLSQEVINDPTTTILLLKAILEHLLTVHALSIQHQLKYKEDAEKLINALGSVIYDHPLATIKDKLNYNAILVEKSIPAEQALENKIKYLSLEAKYKHDAAESHNSHLDLVRIYVHTPYSARKEDLFHQKTYSKRYCAEAMFDRAIKHETYRDAFKPHGERGRASVNYFMMLLLKPPFLSTSWNEKQIVAEKYLKTASGEDLTKPVSGKDKQKSFTGIMLKLLKLASPIRFYDEVICAEINPHVFVMKLAAHPSLNLSQKEISTFQDRYITNIQKSHGLASVKELKAAVKEKNAAIELLIEKCSAPVPHRNSLFGQNGFRASAISVGNVDSVQPNVF